MEHPYIFLWDLEIICGTFNFAFALLVERIPYQYLLCFSSAFEQQALLSDSILHQYLPCFSFRWSWVYCTILWLFSLRMDAVVGGHSASALFLLHVELRILHYSLTCLCFGWNCTWVSAGDCRVSRMLTRWRDAVCYVQSLRTFQIGKLSTGSLLLGSSGCMYSDVVCSSTSLVSNIVESRCLQ